MKQWSFWKDFLQFGRRCRIRPYKDAGLPLFICQVAELVCTNLVKHQDIKKKQLDHFSGCMMFVWCFKLVSWSVSWWDSFPTAINTKNSGRLASPNLQEWPWGLQQYQPFSSSRKASGCHWWCRLWKIQAFECAGGRCILVKQTWGGGFIFLCSSLFGETIQVD